MASVFSQTGIYALRAMATLLHAPRGRALRAQELADETGIPVHYVSKVMRKLVLAGLVEGQRGHGGGFRLPQGARNPSFAAILRAVGALPDGANCAFGLPACSDAHPCVLHASWSALQREVQTWAESTRLKDLAAPDAAAAAPTQRAKRPRRATE